MYKPFQKVPVVEYPNRVTQNPLVTVCVQTYQHVNYIKQCLDGILMQQTSFEFEILLGEDASTDGTREICIDYAKKNPNKIRLILHARRNNIKICGAPSGRFNFLYNLTNASGNYIAFCEGDDYWKDPLKLQKQFDFLENNLDYGIVHTNFERYHQKSKKFELGLNKETELNYFNHYNPFYGILTGKYYIITATVLVRSSLIKNAIRSDIFKNPNNIQGDLPLWLEILTKTRIKYFCDKTSIYRILKNSSSNQKSEIKKIQFQESSKRIRLDYAKKYKVPFEIFRIVEKMYYRVLLDKAFYYKNKNLALESYKKLKGDKNIAIFFKYIGCRNIYLFRITDFLKKSNYWVHFKFSKKIEL